MLAQSLVLGATQLAIVAGSDGLCVLAAAQLPRIAIEQPKMTIGKDTVGAMQAGVFWGYIGLIDGLIDRIRKEYGRPMKVVATGGVASLFEGAAVSIDIFDPDLTIRGLYEIYRRVAAAKAHG